MAEACRGIDLLRRFFSSTTKDYDLVEERLIKTNDYQPSFYRLMDLNFRRFIYTKEEKYQLLEKTL